MSPSPLLRAASQAGLGWTARALAAARLDLRVEGRSLLPAEGPVLLAVRHVHHLWDGVALLAASPRPPHLLVGLDWIGRPALRTAVEALTRAAGWPVVVRPEGLDPRVRTAEAGPASAFGPHERQRYLRRALREVLHLWSEGRVVAVFPQGFPLVDPHLTVGRKASFTPFRPGVAGFTAAARRRLGRDVPVVPVGLAYADAHGRELGAEDPRDEYRPRRWQTVRGSRRLVCRVRFGAPLTPEERRDAESLLRSAEARVRALSDVPPV